MNTTSNCSPDEAIEACVRFMLRDLRDSSPRPTSHDPGSGDSGIAPSVGEHGDDPLPGREIRRRVREHGDDLILGRYYPNEHKDAFRGRIELYSTHLALFFHELMRELALHHSPLQGSAELAAATVAKTLRHEQFHNLADIVRSCHDGFTEGSRNDEEALACAFSHKLVEEEGGGLGASLWSQMDGGLKADYLRLAYSYDAPGYRDWPSVRPTFDGHRSGSAPLSALCGGVDVCDPEGKIRGHVDWMTHHRKLWHEGDKHYRTRRFRCTIEVLPLPSDPS